VAKQLADAYAPGQRSTARQKIKFGLRLPCTSARVLAFGGLLDSPMGSSHLASTTW